ncbi:MAG TPA: zinc-dependent metalloprotease [Streptosporangiaceae bacterium]|nr:zinc-dependent metalloprotease [Streptosporangiaceae bacterium]
MIDWNVATSTATRWVRPGPQVSLSEARRVVAELRTQAEAVHEPVRAVTGLHGGDDGGKVAIVDRPGWIRANISGFQVVLDPLVEHMRDTGAVPAAGTVLTSVGSRVTGMQAGLILSYLASRVLGQYELFLPPDPAVPAAKAPPGRLTLVAPNILMVERELGVDPGDFRRWVCLHEETHRTQFTSVRWLRPYVQQQMTEFLLASDLDPASILNRLRAAADAVSGAVRGADGESLIEAMQTPRQREILDRLTSVMTLVEGHGDYVMDAVGPAVVPSVEQIRAKFNARRSSAGRGEQAIRRILGIDLKMRQYQQGAAFVREIVETAGMASFNRVWTSPQTLPTKDELVNPPKWLERIDGSEGRELNPGVA